MLLGVNMRERESAVERATVRREGSLLTLDFLGARSGWVLSVRCDATEIFSKEVEFSQTLT